MRQVIQNLRTGVLTIEDVPETICKTGGVLVRNAASLISAGTEKSLLDFAEKSLIGKVKERPDLFRQLLDKLRRDGITSTLQTVKSRIDTPVALGYSCAGIVVEVEGGGGEFQPGDRVACAGLNHASHAETVFIPNNLAVKIPDNVSYDEAAFVALGAIAMQGIRTASAKLGDVVAVIGLGLIGQLTIQILRASGCRVIGIDLDPYKVNTAKQFEIECALNRSDDIEYAINRLTEGYGVDAVIITASGNTNDPIELAGTIARDRAIISMVGAVRMDIPRKIFYEKELQLRLSRSYGPGRYDNQYEQSGIDYPIGYVRWTERRNMQEFLRLIDNKSVQVDKLTTHRFSIEQAEKAYKLIKGGGHPSHQYLGILLIYPYLIQRNLRTKKLVVAPFRRPAALKGVNIGVIGAGNFAKSILLPELAKINDAELIALASATGCNAKAVAEKFGFEYATTDYKELLADNDVNAVIITVRHDKHAAIVCEAIKAGKNVLTEKPLAMNNYQLRELISTVSDYGNHLMVGFNRRFSPFSIEAKQFFKGISTLAITYRVNAGAISKDHWIQCSEGGGRVIGEVCHFIDLTQYLTNEEPVEVFAYKSPDNGDTLNIVIKFNKGSIANINYYANGDKRFTKERIEVFGGGRTAVIDNFNRIELYKDGKRKVLKRFKQDKGFQGELTAFTRAIKNGSSMPISLRSMGLTTIATFAIEEA